MDHLLLADLFRAAKAYHGALAQYAAAAHSGDDLESPSQAVIGTALRYRRALDRLLEENDPQAMRVVAGRGRLKRLRTTLENASRRYNLVK